MRGKKYGGLALLLTLLCLLAACGRGGRTGENGGAGAPRPTQEATGEDGGAGASRPTQQIPDPTQQIPDPTQEAPSPTEEVRELWGFPIDDDHDAFEVDTRGKLGTVLVTVERGAQDTSNDFGGYNTTLSVWDMADMDEPIQTMDTQIEGWAFGLSYVVDANFDGHTDFAYKYSQGVQAEMFDLWLWDEEKGQFVAEPAFSDISSPSVFEDTQTIEGWNRFSALGDGVSTVHRWENGELVCVRRIETEALYEETATITVKERVNGELKEVYHKEYLWEDIIDDAEETVPWIHEMLVWEDLNYHGEDS